MMDVRVRQTIIYSYLSVATVYQLPIHAIGLYPNTPPQVDVRPILDVCWQCLGHGRALVSTSAVC